MENKRAYIWAIIGNFTPHAIALFSNMILARFLLPEEYGKVAVLAVFTSIATILLDSGLGGSLIKEKSVSRQDFSTISVFNISVSCIIYVILFLFSGQIEAFYKIDGLKSVARWLCLSFVINSWGVVPKAILIRRVDFKGISQINILSYIISSSLAIIVGVIYKNVYALIVNQLVNSLVQVLLLIYKSGYRFSFTFSFASFKRLIPFGIFTTVTSVIDSIYENLIAIIFGKVYNAQQAGYVSQAKRLEELSSRTVANTVNNVAFPILVKYKDNNELFLSEANKIFRSIILLSLPILLSIALFSDQIVYFLWGNQWITSAYYLKLLMFAGIFILIESLNRNFIKALTIVDQLLKFTVFKRIVGISIIALTALYYPTLLLYSYVISSFIGYLFNNYVYTRHMNISFIAPLSELCKLLLPNILYYVTVSYVLSLGIHICFPILISMVYLLLYYLIILRFYNIDIFEYLKKKTRS